MFGVSFRTLTVTIDTNRTNKISYDDDDDEILSETVKKIIAEKYVS